MLKIFFHLGGNLNREGWGSIPWFRPKSIQVRCSLHVWLKAHTSTLYLYVTKYAAIECSNICCSMKKKNVHINMSMIYIYSSHFPCLMCNWLVFLSFVTCNWYFWCQHLDLCLEGFVCVIIKVASDTAQKTTRIKR
jgi:hypothetical protein